jgi:hypothetical protein
MTNWLILLREIINVYSENHVKPINSLWVKSAELFNVKAGGIYLYHFALKALLSWLKTYCGSISK